MSGFEFIFSLFGLILGLALAEGLGGLSRALKASHRVRIGWPTALLGLFGASAQQVAAEVEATVTKIVERAAKA